jgi:hypothetical protein
MLNDRRERCPSAHLLLADRRHGRRKIPVLEATNRDTKLIWTQIESSRRLSRRSGRNGCAVCAPLDSLGYRFCARPQAEPSTSGNRGCRLTARPCAADKSGSDRWQQCQAQPRQRREIRGIGSSQSSSWLLSRKFQTSLGHRARLFDHLVGAGERRWNVEAEHPCGPEVNQLAGVFSPRSCRRVCPRVGSRRAEARRNRSPRCLRGTIPRAPYLPE